MYYTAGGLHHKIVEYVREELTRRHTEARRTAETRGYAIAQQMQCFALTDEEIEELVAEHDALSQNATKLWWAQCALNRHQICILVTPLYPHTRGVLEFTNRPLTTSLHHLRQQLPVVDGSVPIECAVYLYVVVDGKVEVVVPPDVWGDYLTHLLNINVLSRPSVS